MNWLYDGPRGLSYWRNQPRMTAVTQRAHRIFLLHIPLSSTSIASNKQQEIEPTLPTAAAYHILRCAVPCQQRPLTRQADTLTCAPAGGGGEETKCQTPYPEIPRDPPCGQAC